LLGIQDFNLSSDLFRRPYDGGDVALDDLDRRGMSKGSPQDSMRVADRPDADPRLAERLEPRGDIRRPELL